MAENDELKVYFEELIKIIEDPLHKRILQAYSNGPNPLAAMEKELSQYLIDVLTDEDHQNNC